MNKKIVICIIGRTGAGKDTVADALAKLTGWKKIVSYTDAPKRSDQLNGREHWFVTRDEMTHILNGEDVLAETEINGNRYCTTLNQLSENISIYIIDPNGFYELEKRNDLILIPCVITAGQSVREKRSKTRKNFNFKEREASETKQFDEFYDRQKIYRNEETTWPAACFGNTRTPKDCAEDILRHVNTGIEAEKEK